MDLVSVILPVYNREFTIGRAIESVLNQSYTNIELIIVDDASDDGTAEMIRLYNDKRITLIQSKNRGGAAKARNMGVKVAKGKYIAFQDSDDEWLPTKLEQQIAFMEKNDFKVSFCPYRLYAEKEYVVPCEYLSLSSFQIKEILKKGNVIGTPTLVVRHEVFKEIGLFDENMPALQDYELAIRIAKKYEIGCLSEILVNAYRMEQCITNNADAVNRANALIIAWHKDFIDVKTHLQVYFYKYNIISDEYIDWDAMDNLLKIVCESTAEREYIYMVLAEHMYEKQRKIVDGIDAVYKQFVKQLVCGQFVIYGAGVIGKRTYEKLKSKGLIPKYFVVTEVGEEKEIDSVPIIEFTQLKEKLLPIIVAVSDKNKMDVVRNIQREVSLQYAISSESVLY